jgi:hypothetical protein
LAFSQFLLQLARLLFRLRRPLNGWEAHYQSKMPMRVRARTELPCERVRGRAVGGGRRRLGAESKLLG